MPSFNDLNLAHWKESEIWTDSLWLIPERDKSGKHDGGYHGNFVPQVPRQLILRYTKEGEVVLDPFAGSGTTAFEAERLGRSFVGLEIQKELVDDVTRKLNPVGNFFSLACGDSAKPEAYDPLKQALREHGRKAAQLVILHPPYADIIKFSSFPEDLSNSSSLKDYLARFSRVMRNAVSLLDNRRYLAIVIGDKYSSGQWIPLGFHCMNEALKIGLTLKSVIVKNMVGNRAKRNKQAIWRYRALTSDYFIFKHEYILIFKNELKHKK